MFWIEAPITPIIRNVWSNITSSYRQQCILLHKMSVCLVIIAFLLPFHCWSSPIGGSNTSDVATPTTRHEGHGLGNSANITTTDFSVADVAGATPFGQARHEVASSLTSTQKQDLALKLSSAKYLVNDLMAAYCGLQFFDRPLSTFGISCEQLADWMLGRFGVLPDSTFSDELDGLQEDLTSILTQASAMSDLLVALRDFERDYMERHLMDRSLCSTKTSQEAVLYFCQVLQVRFESAEVAMAQFVLKTTKTIRDLGMTLPQIQAHTFPLPVSVGENEVRIRVLAGIREVQAKIGVLEASLGQY